MPPSFKLISKALLDWYQMKLRYIQYSSKLLMNDLIDLMRKRYGGSFSINGDISSKIYSRKITNYFSVNYAYFYFSNSKILNFLETI
jgi:hypothetical protein